MHWITKTVNIISIKNEQRLLCQGDHTKTKQWLLAYDNLHL